MIEIENLLPQLREFNGKAVAAIIELLDQSRSRNQTDPKGSGRTTFWAITCNFANNHFSRSERKDHLPLLSASEIEVRWIDGLGSFLSLCPEDQNDIDHLPLRCFTIPHDSRDAKAFMISRSEI